MPNANDDCLFCKIAKGEIPSKKAYEDDKVLAFYDIEPQAPLHILVIPKEHIKSMAEITPQNSAVLSHMGEVVASLAAEYKLETGFRVISNVGSDGKQSVPHLHLHLLAGKSFSGKIV